MVKEDPLIDSYIEYIPYVEFMKESLRSCAIRKWEIHIMTRRVKSYGFVLASPKRSLKGVLIIYLPWMGERCHYQLMGLSYDSTSIEPDFFGSWALGK
jgi:hypothetical protein